MRYRSFGDFTDKKKRDAIHQLEIIKSLLERNGLKVENFLETDGDDHNPYIFCRNILKTGSFDGVRIYKIGNDIAFRVQKESKTHPYGSAYPLPIESMFYDFLSDKGMDEKKAGMRIIEAIGKEMRKFFEKSADADREQRNSEIENDSNGSVTTRTSGTDYSAMVFNKS